MSTSNCKNFRFRSCFYKMTLIEFEKLKRLPIGIMLRVVIGIQPTEGGFIVLRSLSLLVCCLPCLAAEPPAPVNARLAGFECRNPTADRAWKFVEETRDSKATVLLFLNTSCPVSTAYVPRLIELHTRFSKDGVVFAALFSAETDGADDVKKHAKDFALPFPALMDDGGKVAA